jgi:phage virion morphogenesis protein
MSGFTIRIAIHDEPVKGLLTRLRQRTGDMTPAMAIIGQIVRSSVIKNFEAEGRPTPWKKSRRTTKTGGRTLTKSGRLMKSITPHAGPVSVEIGTNVVYAAVHQLGKTIEQPARERVLHFKPKDGRRKNSPMVFSKARKAKFAMKVGGKAYSIVMPKREFLMVQPEDWTEIRKALEEYLTGG